jgi:hypothetical protein
MDYQIETALELPQALIKALNHLLMKVLGPLGGLFG